MSSFKICDVGITTEKAGERQAASRMKGFGKPTALSLLAQFSLPGAAGTEADAYVQTSFDGGTTWYDVANFHFTNASGVKYANADLTAQIAPTAPTSGSIADNTVVHGMLGDLVEVLIVTDGTYGAGTKFEIWAEPHG